MLARAGPSTRVSLNDNDVTRISMARLASAAESLLLERDARILMGRGPEGPDELSWRRAALTRGQHLKHGVPARRSRVSLAQRTNGASGERQADGGECGAAWPGVLSTHKDARPQH